MLAVTRVTVHKPNHSWSVLVTLVIQLPEQHTVLTRSSPPPAGTQEVGGGSPRATLQATPPSCRRTRARAHAHAHTHTGPTTLCAPPFTVSPAPARLHVPTTRWYTALGIDPLAFCSGRKDRSPHVLTTTGVRPAFDQYLNSV